MQQDDVESVFLAHDDAHNTFLSYEMQNVVPTQIIVQGENQLTTTKEICIVKECEEIRKGRNRFCGKHQKHRERGKPLELKPGFSLQKPGRPYKPLVECKAPKKKLWRISKKVEHMTNESWQDTLTRYQKHEDPQPIDIFLNNFRQWLKFEVKSEEEKNRIMEYLSQGIQPQDTSIIFGPSEEQQATNTN